MNRHPVEIIGHGDLTAQTAVVFGLQHAIQHRFLDRVCCRDFRNPRLIDVTMASRAAAGAAAAILKSGLALDIVEIVGPGLMSEGFAFRFKLPRFDFETNFSLE